MYKTIFIAAAFLLAAMHSFSQEEILPTDSFVIEGKENSASIAFSDIAKMPVVTLGDVTTMNHRGEVRAVRKGIKGSLLKNAFDQMPLKVAKPKDLFSHYFILEGSDGYKTVLSYNEIFNSGNVYVITESEGNNMTKIEDRIAILILSGPDKGRVAMKGLKKIWIKNVL